jgi:hypothetical protein
MNDAFLVIGFGKTPLDCSIQSFQIICAENQNLLNSAGFQVVHHRKPVFRGFRAPYVHAQNLSLLVQVNSNLGLPNFGFYTKYFTVSCKKSKNVDFFFM